MSWKTFLTHLDKFAKFAGSQVESGLNSVTGAALTNAQIQQNEYNSMEAEKQRNWEEQMSSTAYQRQVADMQAAGVNPALMYGAGSSGASTPSGASASGSAGSGTMSLGDILSLIRFKKDIQVLDAQVSNINADTGVKMTEQTLNEAKTNKEEVSTLEIKLKNTYQQMLNDAFPNVNKAQLAKLAAETAALDAKAGLDISQANLTDIQANIASIEEKYKEELVQASIALMNSQGSAADAAAAASRAAAAWNNFQTAYAHSHNSSLPNGSIVSVLNYLSDRLEMEDKHMDQLIQGWIAVFEHQEARFSGAGFEGSPSGGRGASGSHHSTSTPSYIPGHPFANYIIKKRVERKGGLR